MFARIFWSFPYGRFLKKYTHVCIFYLFPQYSRSRFSLSLPREILPDFVWFILFKKLVYFFCYWIYQHWDCTIVSLSGYAYLICSYKPSFISDIPNLCFSLIFSIDFPRSLSIFIFVSHLFYVLDFARCN